MGADAGDGEDDKPTKLPSAPLALSASAHAALASAVGAVKALLPVDGTSTFVTPLAAGGGAPAPDKVALFSAPDPYVADLEAILTAAEGAPMALVEMPETSKNVALLAKLGGVFKLAAAPGRVWVATYPIPRSIGIQPIEEESMVWAAEKAAPADEGSVGLAAESASSTQGEPGKITAATIAAPLGKANGEHSIEVTTTGDAHHAIARVLKTMQRMGQVGTTKAIYVESDDVGGPAEITGFDGDGSSKILKILVDGDEQTASDADLEGLEKACADAFRAKQKAIGKAGTLLQIGKADGTEERYTLGIVLVPDEADLQGDTYDKATVRRAADIFITDYQNTGLQHNVKPGDIAAFRDEHPDLYNGKILIVDSFVIPDEMGDVVINGQTIKAGTWLMGHRWVDDALWADVKAKKYTGLSMGGFARRIALGTQTAASPAPPALPS
jgi:hypothetical protein